MAEVPWAGSKPKGTAKFRFTHGDRYVKAFMVRCGGGHPGRYGRLPVGSGFIRYKGRRGPTHRQIRGGRQAGQGRRPVLHGPRPYSPCKDFYAYRQRRLRESADPRRIRRLWREPGNRQSQLRHPQGNPGKFGPDRRAQGQRGPARRRFLRLRHGRGRDRPRRIAAARALVRPHPGRRQPQGTGCGHRPVAGPGPERRLPLRRARSTTRTPRR